MQLFNFLSIRERMKSIPYFGDGVKRLDGHANYGFKNLKMDPSGIESIPELTSDADLKALVARVNAPLTGVLSVGCASGPISEASQGSRFTGYVEFALNSASLVADARNYFPVFFDFNKVLYQKKMSDVRFEWQLEQANFFERNTCGFSCAVQIDTKFVSDIVDARTLWGLAVGALGELLGAIPSTRSDLLYRPLDPRTSSDIA
jgi:hypothetical protein